MSYVLVIPTFRRPEALAERLAALTRQTVPPRETIIIDNAADPDTEVVVQHFGAHAPWRVHYDAASENLGPAGGTARGMRLALARHPDVEWIARGDDDGPDLTDEHFAMQLDVARTYAVQYPRLGGVGLTGAVWDRRRAILVKPPQIDGAVQEVDYLATGFFPIFRADGIREVGGFRGDLFFGQDEVEFGLRLRRAGWVILRIDPPGRVRGHGRVTRELPPIDWRRYYSVRNDLVIAREFGSPFAAFRRLVTMLAKIATALPNDPTLTMKHLILTARATTDAALGRLGRRVEPTVEHGRLRPRD